jgi:hypothetical protein
VADQLRRHARPLRCVADAHVRHSLPAIRLTFQLLEGSASVKRPSRQFRLRATTAEVGGHDE